jgi:hypothetical protein
VVVSQRFVVVRHLRHAIQPKKSGSSLEREGQSYNSSSRGSLDSVAQVSDNYDLSVALLPTMSRCSLGCAHMDACACSAGPVPSLDPAHPPRRDSAQAPHYTHRHPYGHTPASSGSWSVVVSSDMSANSGRSNCGVVGPLEASSMGALEASGMSAPCAILTGERGEF